MELLRRMPLYALRAYDSIWVEGEYTLISTNYGIYVLDNKNLQGNYSSRRLQLTYTQNLPYKLYRIDERFTTLAQLVLTRRTKMLDVDGAVIRYRKTRFVRLKYTKVLRNDTTWKGTNRVTTKLSSPFITPQPARYVGYIQDGSTYILFETCDELKPDRRIKI